MPLMGALHTDNPPQIRLAYEFFPDKPAPSDPLGDAALLSQVDEQLKATAGGGGKKAKKPAAEASAASSSDTKGLADNAAAAAGQQGGAGASAAAVAVPRPGAAPQQRVSAGAHSIRPSSAAAAASSSAATAPSAAAATTAAAAAAPTASSSQPPPPPSRFGQDGQPSASGGAAAGDVGGGAAHAATAGAEPYESAAAAHSSGSPDASALPLAMPGPLLGSSPRHTPRKHDGPSRKFCLTIDVRSFQASSRLPLNVASGVVQALLPQELLELMAAGGCKMPNKLTPLRTVPAVDLSRGLEAQLPNGLGTATFAAGVMDLARVLARDPRMHLEVRGTKVVVVVVLLSLLLVIICVVWCVVLSCRVAVFV